MPFLDLVWLSPLFPLLGAAINGLISNRRGLSKSVTTSVALLGSGLAGRWGWAAVVQWALTEDRHKAYVVTVFEWITAGSVRIHDGSLAELTINASFQIDPLSSVLVG